MRFSAAFSIKCKHDELAEWHYNIIADLCNNYYCYNAIAAPSRIPFDRARRLRFERGARVCVGRVGGSSSAAGVGEGEQTSGPQDRGVARGASDGVGERKKRALRWSGPAVAGGRGWRRGAYID